MLVNSSQPSTLTFYLNAYEISPQKSSSRLKAFRVTLDVDVNSRKYLSSTLRKNDILFHYQPSDYLEYKAGYYVYDVEKWSKMIESDEVLSRLEYHEERVEAISYVVRGAILRLIERKLETIEGLRRVKSAIDEMKFCFSHDLLGNESSIFGCYRCFIYRIEYIHKPTRKLLLLILPSLLVVSKVSLEWLVEKKGIPLEQLVGLPFKVQEIEHDTEVSSHIGFLEAVNGDMAIVRLVDLTSEKPIISTPLKNLYLIGRIDLYKGIIDFLGEDYNLLYNYLGKLTFAQENGKKIKDAPLRMKREIEDICEKIFVEKVFPLKLQEITYILSDNLISLETEGE